MNHLLYCMSPLDGALCSNTHPNADQAPSSGVNKYSKLFTKLHLPISTQCPPTLLFKPKLLSSLITHGCPFMSGPLRVLWATLSVLGTAWVGAGALCLSLLSFMQTTCPPACGCGTSKGCVYWPSWSRWHQCAASSGTHDVPAWPCALAAPSSTYGRRLAASQCRCLSKVRCVGVFRVCHQQEVGSTVLAPLWALCTTLLA